MSTCTLFHPLSSAWLDAFCCHISCVSSSGWLRAVLAPILVVSHKILIILLTDLHFPLLLMVLVNHFLPVSDQLIYCHVLPFFHCLIFLLQLILLTFPQHLALVTHLSTLYFLQFFICIFSLRNGHTFCLFPVPFYLLEQAIALMFKKPWFDMLRCVLVDSVFLDVLQNYLFSPSSYLNTRYFWLWVDFRFWLDFASNHGGIFLLFSELACHSDWNHIWLVFFCSRSDSVFQHAWS